MATVTYQGREIELRPEETLLDGLLRAGIVVPFSCRGGICHTCLMRRVDNGAVPEQAQHGLSVQQKQQRYLLPCMCIAEEDMVVALPGEGPQAGEVLVAAHPQLTEEAPREPTPDPEMWTALGEGKLLYGILKDFYSRVYDDARLAPFFKDVTRQHSIEKQYNFLYQTFTGENVYFGERPRNAHHWMVISAELFDYRNALMQTVLREHGLPEHLMKRWEAMEESYRSVIVKERAWPKIRDGQVLPLEGYESLHLDSGTLCDGCGAELNVGEAVQYHVRLGTVYCVTCAAAGTVATA